MRVPPVKSLRKRLRRAVRYELNARWRRMPVEKGTVFYESFSGNGMLCNPEAIFQALLNARDQAHLTHIWALADLDTYRATVAKYSQLPQRAVRQIRIQRLLPGTGHLRVSDQQRDLPAGVQQTPRPGLPEHLARHAAQTDGLRHPRRCPRDSEHHPQFRRRRLPARAEPVHDRPDVRQRLQAPGIFRGSIIEEGYPRTDRQVLDDEQTAQARASLADAGLPIGDRKIVLYAPTWKGLSFGHPNDDIDELVRHVKELESRIDSSKYVRRCSRRTKSCTSLRRIDRMCGASSSPTRSPPTSSWA